MHSYLLSPFYPQTQILQPLKKIWWAADLPCPKRLKVILPLVFTYKSPGPLRNVHPVLHACRNPLSEPFIVEKFSASGG